MVSGLESALARGVSEDCYAYIDVGRHYLLLSFLAMHITSSGVAESSHCVESLIA